MLKFGGCNCKRVIVLNDVTLFVCFLALGWNYFSLTGKREITEWDACLSKLSKSDVG